MALIVEDGSIVPNADSYISLADARTLAANYGWELPAADPDAEIALRNGAGYIGLQEAQLCGTRVSADQALSFPRQGITLYGFPFAADAIPQQVKIAQVASAVEYGAGSDVRASTDGRLTTEERVEGAVTVRYAENGQTGATIAITKALDALRPLICCGNNGTSFNVFRG